MAYRIGGKIEPSDFNTFKASVNQVLGEGATDVGYGQLTTEKSVSIGDTVTAADEWNVLLRDVNILRRHQTGSDVVSLPDVGNVIAFDPLLESAIASALTDRFQVGPGQATIVSDILNSERLTIWEGTLVHAFYVYFPTAETDGNDELRYFFNSGGQIRVFPDYDPNSGTPDTPGTIDNEWKKIIQGVGDIIFDYQETRPTGSPDNSGSGTNIGFYTLPTTLTKLFTKAGGGAYAGGYGAATLELWGRKATATEVGSDSVAVYFELRFNSIETGQDFVTLNVSSNINYRIASDPAGELTVLAPAYETSIELSQDFDANLSVVVLPDANIQATYTSGDISISAEGPIVNAPTVGVLMNGYIAHTADNSVINQIWHTAPDDDIGNLYEVKASNPSGSPTNIVGTFDTWAKISDTRIWTISSELNEQETMTLEIREIADTSNGDKVEITFNADTFTPQTQSIASVNKKATSAKTKRTPRKRF